MTVIRILRDIFAVVVAVATLLHCAAAKRTFVVGGNLGWTVPPKPNAYAIWASNHTFAVDDILLFHFEEGKHTVAKVSKEAYEACNTSITPFFIRRQSTAFVSLDTTGVKFFIDTVGDNCLKGQKVAVDVTIPASPTQPPPSTPSPPPPPPSNSPPSSPATPPASPPPSPPSNSPPSSPATPPASPPPSPPSNSPPSSPATPPASSPPTPPSNNPPASPATPPASSPPSPPSNNPPSSPATPPGTPVSPPSPVTPGPAVPPSSSSSPPPPTQTAPPPPNAATTAGAPIGVVLMSIALGYLIWN